MAQSKSVRLVTEAALDTSQTKVLAPIKGDIADLKVLGGLNPGSPNDASTSNFIETPGTLTHTALSAAIGNSVTDARVQTRVNVNELVAANAAAPLATPTYDGTGQTVHPDVVRIPGGFGPQGFEYWMGITPYPDGVDATENPSILASHDGDTWVVPAGLTNPVAAPVTGFWPDPDLTFDPFKRRLYLVWLGMRVAWSDDGVTWTAPLVLVPSLSGEVSPAVIRDGSGHKMWSVQKVDAGVTNKILYRTGASLEAAWPTAVAECTFSAPAGKEPWHIDVQKVGGLYYALVSCCDAETSGANTVLYLATSLDGLKWEFGESPLITGASGKWDDTNIYRATILPADGTGGIVADIWYSARSAIGKWRTGRTALRWADPAIDTRAPLVAVAHHTNAVESKGSTRNLIDNATMLAATGTRPAGTTNNLVGATGQGWDAERNAYKFTMPGTATAFTLAFAGLPVTANLPYTFTFYGASDTDGHPMSARLLWRDSGGTALRTDQPASAIARPRGGRFARIRLTATAPAGAVTVEAMMVNGAGLGTSVTYYWKKAQLEQSAEPTEWTPGVADRHVAVAGQARNLSEWLGPVNSTGQVVLSSITSNGAFQTPRLATASLPPAAANEGVAFYDTTRKVLVHSDGIAWRVMSTMSTRTVRVVAGGATLTHEDEIVVVTATSYLPPITQTRPIPVGRMFTVKNGSAAGIVFVAADGKEVNGSTASVPIPAWGATSAVWTGTMWVTV